MNTIKLESLTIPRHLPTPHGYKERALAEIIRVNHAGEYGAKMIYLGQLAIIKQPRIKTEIKSMLKQELRHLNYFSMQLEARGIQPTIFKPIWHALGFGLGATTALLGARAAMACTVAVEEVIEQHYSAQLDFLKDDQQETELRSKIAQFLQEELEHRDIGLQYEAQQAPAYGLLYRFTQAASKLAIALSKRF